MLKRTLCLCEIDLEITPVDPLLVKSGYEAVDGTKMAFITTERNGRQEVFLPGSSLKGVMRSHFEKICRTLHPSEPVVCLPYKEYKPEVLETSCGAMFQHRRDLEKDNKAEKDITEGKSERVYRHSCPACRMFGSHFFIGRCGISDAYLLEHVEPEVRPGVAIDRHSGKVAQGPFDYQALNRGAFKTAISIRNFELWMLGAWGYLLQDLEDKIIRIGAHKSRGMGTVEAKVEQIRLSYYIDPQEEVKGLAELVTESEAKDYGLYKYDGHIPIKVAPKIRGLRRVYDITADYRQILSQAAIPFNDYIDAPSYWKSLLDYANAGS